MLLAITFRPKELTHLLIFRRSGLLERTLLALVELRRVLLGVPHVLVLAAFAELVVTRVPGGTFIHHHFIFESLNLVALGFPY